jgi:hypothetical protein
MASIATCSIPAGLLLAGDRVEVRFDLEHQGTASGFGFEVRWGATVVAHRDAAVGDSQVAGRVEGGMVSAGARLSFQSWGSVLPFSAGVQNSTDAYAGGLTIDFQARLAQSSSDTVALRNFTVIRFP